MITKKDLRHAEALLRRWNRNNTPEAQQRLINDPDRLWVLARDLAYALEVFYERETGD